MNDQERARLRALVDEKRRARAGLGSAPKNASLAAAAFTASGGDPELALLAAVRVWPRTPDAARVGQPPVPKPVSRSRKGPPAERRCANPACANIFKPIRSTGLYCSARCRIAVHRSGQR